MGELIAPIDFLQEKFKDLHSDENMENAAHWIMGQLHRQAIGNIELRELRENIDKKLK